LDVSRNTALTWLSCNNNKLTALDVSKNTALTWLSCSNNQLTALDVSPNPDLENLSCSGNQLTTLDVSRNTALKELSCYNNQLTTDALNASFLGLPARDIIYREALYSDTISTDLSMEDDPEDININSGPLYIEDNPGSNTCNRSIATEKGWTFH
jgi:Leucine-rich repeat (LRR) protein